MIPAVFITSNCAPVLSLVDTGKGPQAEDRLVHVERAQDVAQRGRERRAVGVNGLFR